MHRLQVGADPEARLAQKVFEQGHYAGRTQPSSTRQGIYAAAPSGVMLASINSNDAGSVAEMLRRALAKWDSMSEAERMLAGSPAEQKAQIRRAEDYFPHDGLALRVFCRDLPGGQRPSEWRADAWNQSFAWFRPAELELARMKGLKKGDRVELPPIMAQRLATLNFLDTVRGQTPPLQAQDIRRAELSATVVDASGGRLKLELRGATETEKSGTWQVRGFADQPKPQRITMKLELIGRAEVDLAKSRFTAFEMAASGTRSGATQFNVRADDMGEGPIGFFIELTGDDPAERVAPDYFGAYGWR